MDTSSASLTRWATTQDKIIILIKSDQLLKWSRIYTLQDISRAEGIVQVHNDNLAIEHRDQNRVS